MAKMHSKNQLHEAGSFAAQRRLFLRAAGFLPAAAALGLGALPSMAFAGGQLEEPLSDSVRTALSLAVKASSTPPVPIFFDDKSRHIIGTNGRQTSFQFPDWRSDAVYYICVVHFL